MVQSRLHAGDDALGWAFGRNEREFQSSSENASLFFGRLMVRQVFGPFVIGLMSLLYFCFLLQPGEFFLLFRFGLNEG